MYRVSLKIGVLDLRGIERFQIRKVEGRTQLKLNLTNWDVFSA